MYIFSTCVNYDSWSERGWKLPTNVQPENSGYTVDESTGLTVDGATEANIDAQQSETLNSMSDSD